MAWDVTRFNPANDWQIFDGTETITYYPYSPNSTEDDELYLDEFDTPCLYREVSQDQIGLTSGETTGEIVGIVTVPSSFFGDPPHKRDKLIRTNGSDTIAYIVQSVHHSTLGTRYKLEVTKQS